ncbi:hypothetical protein FI667_g14077, partial [Globisporangium splendens]
MHAIKSAVASVALLSAPVAAWNGQVTFYENAYFGGNAFTVNLSTSQRCFNLGCFNDRASSVKWSNLVSSSVVGAGYPFIAFYTDVNCGGAVREWKIVENNFPQNLAFDGINDAITSFMIWENSPFKSKGDYLVCPWSRRALREETNEANATEATNATAVTIIVSEADAVEVCGRTPAAFGCHAAHWISECHDETDTSASEALTLHSSPQVHAILMARSHHTKTRRSGGPVTKSFSYDRT